jgi:hypothetical protein
MTNATDLAGAPRIINSITDMGAYESGLRDIAVQSVGDPAHRAPTVEHTFTGYVVARTPVEYIIGGLQRTAHGTAGYGLGVVTQTYSGRRALHDYVGRQQCRRRVSQGTRANLITAAPRFAYVAPGGAHQYPYTNWMIAATDAVAAVAAAWHGSQVLVTDGVYAIRSPIELAVGAVLRSSNGPRQPCWMDERRPLPDAEPPAGPQPAALP